METPHLHHRRRVFAWALYDWANSSFPTTIALVFFPILLGSYYIDDNAPGTSTFLLGLGNSTASLIVALSAPFLGALADQCGGKKRLLAGFALLGIAMSGGLYFVQQGQWLLALAIYILAGIGFAGGNIFYDAMLVSVAAREKRDFVSALGFSLGYLGGGLLFLLNTLMITDPGRFGLADVGQASRAAFLTVALWWFVFTIPILLWVPEPPGREKISLAAAKAGWKQVLGTVGKLRQYRSVLWFLLAYWLYIDGVHTVARMATSYGEALGIDRQEMVKALLITQFVGFPSALLFGKLAGKIGAKSGIRIGVCVYVVVCIWGGFMRTEREFYVLAVSIGLVQGGLQALSRSFYSMMIPSDVAGEFFGFYNMLGKFAAVLGPTLMGVASLVSDRLSIVSIIILFILGLFALEKVEVPTENGDEDDERERSNGTGGAATGSD